MRVAPKMTVPRAAAVRGRAGLYRVLRLAPGRDQERARGDGGAAARGAKPVWDVPYLTVDPADLGRHYREVIRVNSQSGKGGVAYLLESEFGIVLPKEMQREFGPLANDEVDSLGREVTGAELREIFWREYIERNAPLELQSFETRGRGRRGALQGRAARERRGRSSSRARATDPSLPSSRRSPWRGVQDSRWRIITSTRSPSAPRRAPSPTSRSSSPMAAHIGARPSIRTSSWLRSRRS